MKRTILYLILLLSVLLIGLADKAHAQQKTTVRIEDGAVYVNGDRVPANELPPSLNISGVQARFNFEGDDEAFLDLGGHVYRFAGNRLFEVAENQPGANDLVVVFSSDEGGTPVRFVKSDRSATYHMRVRGDEAVEKVGLRLQEQAAKLEQLESEIRANGSAELKGVLVRMTEEARSAAQIAEELPRVQFQAYMNSIGDRDSDLFQRLQREQELEYRTRQLAAQIRSSQDAEEKQRLTEELRTELETIFALKQENREREIEQLTERLGELEARLKERQDLRDRIIESRMLELLGRSDW